MLRKEILGTKIKTQSGLSKPITIAQPKDDSDYKSENFLDTDILLAKDIKQFVKGQEIDTSNLFRLNEKNIITDETFIESDSSTGIRFYGESLLMYKNEDGKILPGVQVVYTNFRNTLCPYIYLFSNINNEDGTSERLSSYLSTDQFVINHSSSTTIPYVVTGRMNNRFDGRQFYGVFADNRESKKYIAGFVANGGDEYSLVFDKYISVNNDKAWSMKITPTTICMQYLAQDPIELVKIDPETNTPSLKVQSISSVLKGKCVKIDSPVSISSYIDVGDNGREVSIHQNGIELTVDSQPISFLSIGEPDEDNYTETTVTADNLSARNGGLYITGNTKITGTLETTGRINATGGITVSNGITEYGNFSFGDGRIRGSVSIAKINKSNDKYLTCADTAQQSSTKVYTTDGGIQETVLKSDYDALVARVAALEAKLTQ